MRHEETGVRCPTCKGSGIDPTTNHRYTSGGHDDRTCGTCFGECYIFSDDDATVAQLAERQFCKLDVGGSSPFGGSD